MKRILTFCIILLLFAPVFAQKQVSVCSFNIKFIGLYTKKDAVSLADLLKGYDVVIVQELVSPPADGVYPDGTAYTADAESRLFVESMTAHGFNYSLSSEDTGSGDKIHTGASSTEWFIAFYKPNCVSIAQDLITDFVADDRSNHNSYERVPHAFSFRTIDKKLDFTLISVHLKPGSGPSSRARRAEELGAIGSWINANNQTEKDFIILGDMNIYKQEELIAVTPAGYRSLNYDCVPTNLASTGYPYDHIMYNTTHTATEIKDSFEVIDLIAAMRGYWNPANGTYPENDLNLFYQYYSDHKPVVFYLIPGDRDDD